MIYSQYLAISRIVGSKGYYVNWHVLYNRKQSKKRNVRSIPCQSDKNSPF